MYGSIIAPYKEKYSLKFQHTGFHMNIFLNKLFIKFILFSSLNFCAIAFELSRLGSISDPTGDSQTGASSTPDVASPNRNLRMDVKPAVQSASISLVNVKDPMASFTKSR